MSVYDLPVQTLDGKDTTLGELTGGKPALIVNVASKCGLTPQYTQLEELHAQTEGLTVVGVPCNQFKGQEPGSPEEIAEFCSATYGVTFPMLAKVDVNGPDRHPLFDTLAEVPDADGKTGDVAWNFEKWLVAADGQPVARFRPLTSPDDPQVQQAVKDLVAG